MTVTENEERVKLIPQVMILFLIGVIITGIIWPPKNGLAITRQVKVI